MFMGSVKTVRNKKRCIAANNVLALFIAGSLIGITALCCPCPVCIGLTGIFIANGIRETTRKNKH